MSNRAKKILKLLGRRFQSHPWHGIEMGDNTPKEVNAFIEIVPSDTIKYEIDKSSGFLMVDRPQKFSNIIPALYGFVPQSYCAEKVADFCMEKSKKKNLVGDEDPLDICVLTERDIRHGNILLEAIPIGGFRMVDGGEADDKIIAVLKGDEAYAAWTDISDVPKSIVKRLKHYFLTYKQLPGQTPKCEITHTYGKEDALEVIQRSKEDYQKHFGNIDEVLIDELKKLD